ncbi:hypothetical protein PAXRUDRAFT_823175 [Paxillus rubicundulus Ve08.2h10]|uniref:Uncharacterized protein n=1 Tax=Paxillus rubicundulus Ve08.2h10 TaxID=930991 RepID=A0A0D0DVR6_9AGAM|nr:hypothetical protein PAXRUDRAFT_823175 [Paxillus rubicundulus Ve08.2h10]
MACNRPGCRTNNHSDERISLPPLNRLHKDLVHVFMYQLWMIVIESCAHIDRRLDVMMSEKSALVPTRLSCPLDTNIGGEGDAPWTHTYLSRHSFHLVLQRRQAPSFSGLHTCKYSIVCSYLDHVMVPAVAKFQLV